MSTVTLFDRGFVSLGTWRRVPVRLHWTAPVGAVLFGGLRIAPAVWFAFFTLVLVHELGHAYLVRRYEHHVMAIDVTGFGGLCRWVGSATTYERAAIAWGGVLAQAALLLPSALAYAAFGPPYSELGRELVSGFIFANFWLIVLNLLPLPPFDGAEAWPLARMLFARWRGEVRERRNTPPISMRGGTPSSFPPAPGSEAPRSTRAHELAAVLKRIAEAAGAARRSTPSVRPRSR